MVPVHAGIRAEVLGLKVRPGQAAFAGQMPSALLAAEQDTASEAWAILYAGQVTGFYRLDFNVRAIAGRDFGRPSAGLRSFFIGAGWQGRGLGGQALRAVRADLRTRHPEIELLTLSVAVRNTAARRLYLRAGFQDHGELHQGWDGPQSVMLGEI